MSTKKSKAQIEEAPTRSQKQQKFARVVAWMVIGALVLSIAIPAIIGILSKIL